MVRILAISDIHSNVPCVRMLRAQEQNRFDVIVIAGDIGSDRATEIFEVLNCLDCPVFYVYGNHDSRLSETSYFGVNCKLLHFNMFEIGGFIFTGISDLPRSAHGLTLAIPEDFSSALYISACRRQIARMLWQNGIDLRRVIYVNHYQDTWLAESFPNLLMHIFGDIHTFSVRSKKGIPVINVSALDRMVTVYPRGETRTHGNLLNANAGNYAVIEIDNDRQISVQYQLLARRYQSYLWRDNRERWSGLPLIPEESGFGDNVCFRP